MTETSDAEPGMMKQTLASGSEDVPPASDLSVDVVERLHPNEGKLGGWLMLFALSMIVLSPVVLGLTQMHLYDSFITGFWSNTRITHGSGSQIYITRNLPSEDFTSSPYANIFVVDSVLSGLLAVAGIVCGMKILRRKEDAIHFARFLLIIMFIYSVISSSFFSIKLYMSATASFVDAKSGVDLMPDRMGWALAIVRALLPFTVWYCYLSFSRKVSASFGLATGAEGRQLRRALNQIRDFPVLFDRKRWGYNYFLLLGFLITAVHGYYYSTMAHMFYTTPRSYFPTFYLYWSQDLFAIGRAFVLLVVPFALFSLLKRKTSYVAAFTLGWIVVSVVWQFGISLLDVPWAGHGVGFELSSLLTMMIYPACLVTAFVLLVNVLGFRSYSFVLAFFLARTIGVAQVYLPELLSGDSGLSAETLVEESIAVVEYSIVSGLILYWSLRLFLEAKLNAEGRATMPDTGA
jgi:hypothetical protein